MNLQSNQADGPVISIHDMPENVTYDDLKKHVRMKVPGSCLKAGFFWLSSTGKQLHNLDNDKDLNEAKRGNTDSKTSQQCLRLAVVVDSGM